MSDSAAYTHPMDVPEAQQMIRRLCELQAEVSNVLGYDHAADCFCGEDSMSDSAAWRSRWFPLLACSAFGYVVLFVHLARLA